MAMLSLALVGPIVAGRKMYPSLVASVAADDVSLRASGKTNQIFVVFPSAVVALSEDCARAGFELASDKAFAMASTAALGATVASVLRGVGATHVEALRNLGVGDRYARKRSSKVAQQRAAASKSRAKRLRWVSSATSRAHRASVVTLALSAAVL